MRGRGQYINDKGLLVTSGEIVEITGTTVQVKPNAGADPGEGSAAFSIVKLTKFCRAGKSSTFGSFKKGEMITIASDLGKKRALSIRSGPMLFAGFPGAVELKRYDCSH